MSKVLWNEMGCIAWIYWSVFLSARVHHVDREIGAGKEDATAVFGIRPEGVVDWLIG